VEWWVLAWTIQQEIPRSTTKLNIINMLDQMYK